MNPAPLIARLESFGLALPSVLADLPRDAAIFKPPSQAWSILEIVNHLADEEVRDFRARVRLTLECPEVPWPQIDPAAWPIEEKYLDRELTGSVARFCAERRDSIKWLRALETPDWSRCHVHPTAGPVTAGSLLGAWAAHDALHLRQIAKRLYELAERDSGESVRYAGEWGP